MNTKNTNQQFWQPHIDAWQASGLSGPTFCQQHDLPYHRFSYWRRKLSQAKTSASVFSQVICTSDNTRSSGLSLVLPNGMEVRGVHEHNLSVVHALVGGL